VVGEILVRRVEHVNGYEQFFGEVGVTVRSRFFVVNNGRIMKNASDFSSRRLGNVKDHVQRGDAANLSLSVSVDRKIGIDSSEPRARIWNGRRETSGRLAQ
jgi:hypothetical protein